MCTGTHTYLYGIGLVRILKQASSSHTLDIHTYMNTQLQLKLYIVMYVSLSSNATANTQLQTCPVLHVYSMYVYTYVRTLASLHILPYCHDVRICDLTFAFTAYA